ncbi:hypothetical protein [Maridesulfovibrio frigidus]|uniref:hypothetical protein n=1 Tax=Maridesulfovibrio frigidus TaxID=340956 RepID=UPI001F1DAE40|nr:hypothetical protein [Maridesulfovibrio frigidus]
MGTVIEKFDRKISKELSSRYLPGTQLILYRFTDPLGQAREQVASVSINKWESLSPGDNIVVYYAKSAPRISRIKGEEESSTVTILAKFSRPEI